MATLEELVASVPDEVLDYIEELETRVESLEAAGVAKSDEDPDEFEKALSTLSPEMAEVFKAQRDRLTKAEEALAAEQVAKSTAEWVSKARSLDGIVDNPEAFGAGLREVAETNRELADSIVTALEAANTRLAKSDLFAELGHSTRSLTGTAYEKVQNIAKAMTDADPALTAEEAEARAWESNPELYEQHVNERREALRGG